MRVSMKKTAMVAGAAALALSAALASAHPGGWGPGWGMGYGMGPGHGMGPGGYGMMGPGGYGMMGPGGYGMMGPGGYGMGPGGMHMGPGMMGFGPGGGGMGPGAWGDPAGALDARLAAVKDELKITAGQENAWQAYATQVKSQVETMRAWMQTMHASPPATPTEHLERHDAMLKQRLALSEERIKAVKALWDVLTPEQRTLAEQRMFAMGPGFGPRGPGGPGGPGYGPGGRWR